RPLRFWQWRVLPIPGALVLARRQRALQRVGATVAESLIQATDAIVSRGDEHQIARRPRIEVAVREYARHSELRHLRDVVPADHLPFVGQNRIDPRVVWTITDRVVVEIRH